MKKSIFKFLHKQKYEILLFALIQHLYIGVFLNDLHFYTEFIWPINMLIIGIASVGIFVEKGKWKKIIRNILFILVLLFPIALPFYKHEPHFMQLLNLSYVLFFMFIFFEILKYLIKPSYINSDIISASACGYFLMIEICTFLLQFFLYNNANSFKGITPTNSADTYIDLVYFSSITITSIGYGDITPNDHHTKLLTSLFGVIGQFYSVVLVGILISKFSSKTNEV